MHVDDRLQLNVADQLGTDNISRSKSVSQSINRAFISKIDLYNKRYTSKHDSIGMF